MPIEIDDIKKIRKKLGITQTELAMLASVSQSLIAKVEAGSIDPTYSNARKILDALNAIGKSKEKKAIDVMTRKIVFISPDDSIHAAIDKMKKFNISQIPVLSSEKCIGLVSESGILNAVFKGKGQKVNDVMEEVPPIISKSSGISVITELLKFYSIVLVAEKGKIIGIISKSDIISEINR